MLPGHRCSTEGRPAEVNFTATCDGFDDLGQSLNAGDSPIELASTKVGDDDAIRAVSYRQLGSFGGGSVLDENWKQGEATQPGQDIPGAGVAEVPACRKAGRDSRSQSAFLS